jgi:hypothetical protein
MVSVDDLAERQNIFGSHAWRPSRRAKNQITRSQQVRELVKNTYDPVTGEPCDPFTGVLLSITAQPNEHLSDDNAPWSENGGVMLDGGGWGLFISAAAYHAIHPTTTAPPKPGNTRPCFISTYPTYEEAREAYEAIQDNMASGARMTPANHMYQTHLNLMIVGLPPLIL